MLPRTHRGVPNREEKLTGIGSSPLWLDDLGKPLRYMEFDSRTFRAEFPVQRVHVNGLNTSPIGLGRRLLRSLNLCHKGETAMNISPVAVPR
jgi:hypothetical protein